MKGKLLQRLDSLYEFEREPVTSNKLQGGAYFAGTFAGEHVAATEFVIGALFVNFGARAADVFLGLIVGNLLAVFSWALVCAPIAVDTRLTLYWYLRKIGGPGLAFIYNILNAVLYCILAGTMITVSASAVRIPFGIPEQTSWFPTDIRFVFIVLLVGAVVVTLAIFGFKKLAMFSTLCSPWLLAMFLAGAILALTALGKVDGLSGFLDIARTRVWKGPGGDPKGSLGFWHIAAFAWICNLAMHLGLSDMAIFRFAKKKWYGFYSAFGMFLGHYLAWIAAGIMGAGAAVMLGKPLTSLDSGSVAYAVLGTSGAIAVVVAGWTTSNPTLYRAGLAFQAVTPGWPRWAVTLAAGVVTTAIACLPFVFTKLLSFVGIYGILLLPVGAIVVTEHWIFPVIGLKRYWAEGKTWNAPALLSWAISIALGTFLWQGGILHLFFLVVPLWVTSSLLYIVFASIGGAGGGSEPFGTVKGVTGHESRTTAKKPVEGKKGFPVFLFGTVAVASLLLSVLIPFFSTFIYEKRHFERNILLALTLVYFVSAYLFASSRKGKSRGKQASGPIE